MATQITISFNDRNYTLEYTRNSVKQMEQQGFVLDQISDKPMTMVPLLVRGAFLKHHRNIKPSEVDNIYEHLNDKVGSEEESGFIQVLLEMYAETVTTLTDNNSVDEGNVATWKVIKG